MHGPMQADRGDQQLRGDRRDWGGTRRIGTFADISPDIREYHRVERGIGGMGFVRIVSNAG